MAEAPLSDASKPEAPLSDASKPEAPLSDASALCVSCGLCCTGVLFSFAPCEAAELPRMRALGMGVGRHGDRPHFELPCRHNHDGHCGIYDQRFSKCRTFRCELLRRLDDGTVTPDDAHARVAAAHAMVARIAILDPAATQAAARRRLRAAGPPAPDQALLWVEALALETFLDRHFRRLNAIGWTDDDDASGEPIKT